MGRRSDSESDSSRSRKSKKKKSKKSKSRRRSRSYSSSRKGSRSPSSRYRRSRSRSRTHSRRSSVDRSRRSRSRSYDRDRRSRSRSYDYYRSSSRRRSRSRSYEKSRYRSRSRSTSRRRSRSSERRRRSRSGSRSRGHRKKSKSPTSEIHENISSDPAASVPGYEEMTPAEKAEARMRLALKAAAVADEKVKAMSKESSGGQASPLTFEEQRMRTKAIEEIESSGFNPATFTSSRTQIKQEPGSGAELSHDSAIFGHSVSLAVNGSNAERDREGILHPNLYVSEEEKMQNWVKKLAQMRRRKLEGDAMT